MRSGERASGSLETQVALPAGNASLTSCWGGFRSGPSGIRAYEISLCRGGEGCSGDVDFSTVLPSHTNETCESLSSALDAGVYTLHVVAVSGAGLRSWPTELRLIVDGTPPLPFAPRVHTGAPSAQHQPSDCCIRISWPHWLD